jgi:hypothetical protein
MYTGEYEEEPRVPQLAALLHVQSATESKSGDPRRTKASIAGTEGFEPSCVSPYS